MFAIKSTLFKTYTEILIYYFNIIPFISLICTSKYNRLINGLFNLRYILFQNFVTKSRIIYLFVVFKHIF